MSEPEQPPFEMEEVVVDDIEFDRQTIMSTGTQQQHVNVTVGEGKDEWLELARFAANNARRFAFLTLGVCTLFGTGYAGYTVIPNFL